MPSRHVLLASLLPSAQTMHESLLTGYFLFQFVLKSNWRYQNSMTISRFRIGYVLTDSFIILHFFFYIFAFYIKVKT